MFTKIDLTKVPLVSHRLILFQGGFLQGEGSGHSIREGLKHRPRFLSIPFPFSLPTHYISMLLQDAQICIPPGPRGSAVWKGPTGGRRVKERQREVCRHEGGGHRQGSRAHVHLRRLMNDGDND